MNGGRRYGRTKARGQAIASAPILVGAGIVLLTALIWELVHWSYQGLLSGKDAHIVPLDRRLADYRDHLNGASPEEARRRIDALEVEVKTLHIRLTPRRLTGAQRSPYRTALAGHQAHPHAASLSPLRTAAATVKPSRLKLQRPCALLTTGR